MNKCCHCRKEKEINSFVKNNKILKTCLDCREKSNLWKISNTKVIKQYQKIYREKNLDNTEKIFIYARKKDSQDNWQEFTSQLEASRVLNLQASNINKVLKNKITNTGGYEFKIEKQIYKSELTDWNKFKEDNNIISKCIGQPSNNRVLHETINNIIGKTCCKCKNWQPLREYNYSSTHWDKLRNDCKQCLKIWRKENREKLNKNHIKYEKNRKKIDPKFKIIKTLRSRLGTAIRNQKINKTVNTLDLLSCSLDFFKEYIENKFIDGMTWENHGKWHIDHIKPCALFNLLDEEEQKKCFHYTNLQPLWANENLSKGCKYNENNK